MNEHLAGEFCLHDDIQQGVTIIIINAHLYIYILSDSGCFVAICAFFNGQCVKYMHTKSKIQCFYTCAYMVFNDIIQGAWGKMEYLCMYNI